VEPRKIVGRRRETNPLQTLERLNRFLERIRPRATRPPNRLKDGSWPVRKRLGRPEPR
jgi:hypothetical protein